MKKVIGGILMVFFLAAGFKAVAAEGPAAKEIAKDTKKLETMCRKELETYCRTVTPGNNRGLACLYAHSDKLSGPCESAFYDAAEDLQNATNDLNAFVSACRADMEKLCSKVAVGEGRIRACLEKNEGQVSAKCNQVLQRAGGNPVPKPKKAVPDYQSQAASFH